MVGDAMEKEELWKEGSFDPVLILSHVKDKEIEV